VSKELDNEKNENGDLLCPWCDEVVYEGQCVVISYNEMMHVGCAADEQDNIDFDSIMEFGS